MDLLAHFVDHLLEQIWKDLNYSDGLAGSQTDPIHGCSGVKSRLAKPCRSYLINVDTSWRSFVFSGFHSGHFR